LHKPQLLMVSLDGGAYWYNALGMLPTYPLLTSCVPDLKLHGIAVNCQRLRHKWSPGKRKNSFKCKLTVSYPAIYHPPSRECLVAWACH